MSINKDYDISFSPHCHDILKLPEQYRLMHIQPPKKKSKHKHRHHRPQDPLPPGTESLTITSFCLCSEKYEYVVSQMKTFKDFE